MSPGQRFGGQTCWLEEAYACLLGPSVLTRSVSVICGSDLLMSQSKTWSNLLFYNLDEHFVRSGDYSVRVTHGIRLGESEDYCAR